MLVLSRKAGESIVIDQGDKPPIVVTVCRVRDGSVRIGVEAEKGTRIMRAELLDERKEGEAA